MGRDRASLVYALVELSQQPTAVVYSQVARVSDALAAAEAMAQLETVEQEQLSFEGAVASARLPGLQEIYRLQRIFNGILYLTPAENLAALAALPGVVSVRIVTPNELDNAASVPFLGVDELWSLGVPLHGNGIRVAVIDTGIDYTHANFGGPGTETDYTGNDPTLVEAGTFPTAKVVGGYDFAGPTYDAGDALNAVPVPDADPLDLGGHGSHVAGTVAGYGVNSDGTTYGGTYDMSLDTSTLLIGPGAAPEASLYALKVFGDVGGSTALAAQALEWATDPNGDGDFSDHLDVVNLSLGSSFGNSVDTEAIFYRNAVQAGVVVVCSAGNASDVYFITGAPGSTPEVISVAATLSDRLAYPGLRVNAPASIAGVMLAATPSYPAAATPTSGDVVYAVPADGCTAITNDVSGKIALIDRGGCTFQVKIDGAAAAGAIGVVVANNVVGAPIGMSVSDTTAIPSRMIALADGTAIKAELAVPNVVNVTISDAEIYWSSTQADEMASFSSRGPSRARQQPVLKPDIAAPGYGIVSTAVGTGFEPATYSGTSMSSPLVAGVMALLLEAHPDWTPGELKALAMNTANHDLFTLASDPATQVNPGRVGAGRVDPVAALDSMVLAYDKEAPERVSVSFATVDVPAALTETRTVRLRNKGGTPVVYDASVVPSTLMPGTSVNLVTASPVTVPANGYVDVVIDLVARPDAMVRARDASVADARSGLPRYWVSETTGYVVFVPQSGAATLRVPFYAAPSPASDMGSAGPLQPAARAGTGAISLVGAGVDTLALAPPPLGALSLVTPFELAYTSANDAPVGFPIPDDFDGAELDFADLEHVGVTSTYGDVGTVADAEIFFGLTTHGMWGSPSPREVELDIYIRKAGAPEWQYALYNGDYGTSSATPGNDVFLSVLVDLSAGTASLQDFVNGFAPSQLHIPTFLSDTMVLGVFPSDLGLTETESAIEFQVVSFSGRFSGPVDISPVLRYDLKNPAFTTLVDARIASPGTMPVWLDADGESLPVAYDLDAVAGDTAALLLIHHLNAGGARGELVEVASPDCRLATGSCPLHTYCSADSGECLDATALVATADEPAGANCTAGGVRIDTGLDDDNDGILDPEEVQSSSYVCNAVAQLVSVTPVAPGTTCAYGGQLIETGADANGDGVLQVEEVTYTQAVCNGVASLVAASDELPGANCPYGGKRIDTGIDADGDGVLATTEISDTVYVCNGADGVDGSDGADGHSALVDLVELAAGDTNCPTGGVQISAGVDLDDDGVLSSIEVTETSYVCNGATGATGPEGPRGPQGPAGLPGEDGCNATGGDPSALMLLGLLGLVARRRRR